MALDFTVTQTPSIGSNIEYDERPKSRSRTYQQQTDQNGDTCAESDAQEDISEYTVNFKYCGTNFAGDGTTANGDANTFLTDLAMTGYAVTGLEISMDAAGTTTGSVTYHEHESGESAMPGVLGGHTALPAFDVRDYFPANVGAEGLPLLAEMPGITGEGDGMKTFSLSIRLDHTDVNGRSNLQLDGTSRNCRIDMTCGGVGTPGTILGSANGATATAVTWKDDGQDYTESINGDTWTQRGHAYVTRT